LTLALLLTRLTLFTPDLMMIALFIKQWFRRVDPSSQIAGLQNALTYFKLSAFGTEDELLKN
jgi:hypothetical protein